jgi:ATP-dependent protease HslVU (ClpYQ) peptidase subunit
MSTIVVVKKSGLAAVAADSLTTTGTAKDSAEYVVNHEKVIRVGDSLLAISAPTSAKLAIQDYFRNKPETDLTSVDSIFRTWLELHRALRDRYFMRPEEHEDDAYESTRADVLIANPAGIFGVAAHRAVQQFSKYYAYGWGSQFALGAMHALYPEPELSAEDIARGAVRAAAEFDTKTGLPVICYSLRLRG